MRSITHVTPPKMDKGSCRGSYRIDSASAAAENKGVMSADVASTTDPVELADSQAVVEHLLQGTPLDPEVDRRVHERAARITDELRRKYGTLDIAVDLVRQVREE
jgi:hypothetical protein